MDLERRYSRLAILVILAGVCVRLVEMLLARGMLIDDAYITLRYARNFALGHGMVYNPGEHVLGAPPVYVFITAGLWWLSRFFGGAEGAAVGYVLSLFNIALMGATAWLLVQQMRRSLGTWTLLLLVYFCFYLPFIDNTTTGMETTLFLLLLVLSLRFIDTRRLWAASLCMGLAVLVRAEGLLWIAAVGVTHLRRGGKWWAPGLLVPLLAVGAGWTIVSLGYYGTPIPHNVAAKSGWNVPLWGREGILPYAWWVLNDLTLVPHPGGPAPRVLGVALTAIVVLLVLALGIAGTRALWRTRDTNLAWGLLFAGYVLFFLAGRGASGPSWYAIPPGLAIAIAAVHGLRWLPRLGDRDVPGAAITNPRLVVCGALALAFLGGSLFAWSRLRLPYYRLMETGYGRTGRYLSGAATESRLLVNEIGYIGYLADRYIYDMAGIVTPEILAQRKQTRGEIDVPALMQRYEPDYVVVTGPSKRAAVQASVESGEIADYGIALEAPPCFTFVRSPLEDRGPGEEQELFARAACGRASITPGP
jgi:hypothetical protein